MVWLSLYIALSSIIVSFFISNPVMYKRNMPICIGRFSDMQVLRGRPIDHVLHMCYLPKANLISNASEFPSLPSIAPGKQFYRLRPPVIPSVTGLTQWQGEAKKRWWFSGGCSSIVPQAFRGALEPPSDVTSLSYLRRGTNDRALRVARWPTLRFALWQE